MTKDEKLRNLRRACRRAGWSNYVIREAERGSKRRVFAWSTSVNELWRVVYANTVSPHQIIRCSMCSRPANRVGERWPHDTGDTLCAKHSRTALLKTKGHKIPHG